MQNVTEAAYELTHLGFLVTVVEAQKRLGGRVHSVQDMVPGKTIEGGGELIGSNHPVWSAYKQKFNFTFLPVSEGGNSPTILDHRFLTPAQKKRLAKELDKEIQALTDLARPVNADQPWNSPRAKSLDHTPLAEWIAGLSCSALAKLALKGQLEADNGTPAAKQSLLGNLAMIKGGSRGGNQQLADSLASILPPERIIRGVPVTHVSTKNQVAVKLADGRELPGEDIVLAVPPNVWDKIVFTPLLDRKLKPSMGQTVKFVMSFHREFWNQNNLSPNYSADGPIDLTWESTDHQKGSGVAVVAFSGARTPRRAVDGLPPTGLESTSPRLVAPTKQAQELGGQALLRLAVRPVGARVLRFPSTWRNHFHRPRAESRNWSATLCRRAHLLRVHRIYGRRAPEWNHCGGKDRQEVRLSAGSAGEGLEPKYELNRSRKNVAMALLSRFSPPACPPDFHGIPDQFDQWHQGISAWFDGAIKSEVPAVLTANAGSKGIVQFFNPSTYDPGAALVEQTIVWNAFPKELFRQFGRHQALVEADRLWPLSRYSPRWTGPSLDRNFYRNEYCEWHVIRDPETSKIRKVTFTFEPPEYWQALFGGTLQTTSGISRATVTPSLRFIDPSLAPPSSCRILSPPRALPRRMGKWSL